MYPEPPRDRRNRQSLGSPNSKRLVIADEMFFEYPDLFLSTRPLKPLAYSPVIQAEFPRDLFAGKAPPHFQGSLIFFPVDSVNLNLFHTFLYHEQPRRLANDVG